MKVVQCPHCGSSRLVTSPVPKDVVVVLPCPDCHEYVVMYRNKVVALNRAILDQGSREERKAHIADIVEVFLPRGIFSESMEEAGNDHDSAEDTDEELDEEESGLDSIEDPITQDEFDEFVHIQLHKIDDPAYFKKYFG